MNPKNAGQAHSGNRLNRDGVRGIVTSFIGIFIGLIILLIAAGRIDWSNGWLFFALVLGYEVTYVCLFLRVNPGLVNERGKILPKGRKRFDLVFAALYLPLYFSILIISAIDAGRYGWTNMPVGVVFIGVTMFILASIFSFWAMYANTFFNCMISIQEDRKQEVVVKGPYRIVRHPGYIAGIFSTLASPLVLGSWWGLIPSSVLISTIVIRTALEDRTLQGEMPGYKEYALLTRYRLIPFLW